MMMNNLATLALILGVAILAGGAFALFDWTFTLGLAHARRRKRDSHASAPIVLLAERRTRLDAAVRAAPDVSRVRPLWLENARLDLREDAATEARRARLKAIQAAWRN